MKKWLKLKIRHYPIATVELNITYYLLKLKQSIKKLWKTCKNFKYSTMEISRKYIIYESYIKSCINKN